MRLFYTECETSYGLDLINAINQGEQGPRVVWSGSQFKTWSRNDLKKKPSFDSIDVLDTKLLYKRATLHSNFEKYFEKIDQDVIEFFTNIELDFYTLTDRTNYVPVTFRERKRFFRDLIRFWIGFLKAEKIEGVYFPYAPHVPHELVLYQAARYLGLKCFYFSHTAINNWSLIRTNFQEIDFVPTDYLEQRTVEQIKSEIPENLLNDLYADSIVTNAVIKDNDSFNKQDINVKKIAFSTSVETYKRTLKSQVRAKLGTFYHSLLKRKASKFYLPMAMDEKSNLSYWNKAGKKHDLFAADLKSFHDDHAKTIDLTKPFIYFAMHLQPEQTTQPEAGIFEDHLLVLETLVNALPDDLYIYIKENPRQYDTSINRVSAQHFRDKTDLEEFLKSHKRVKLVPQTVKTKDLIKKAFVCVTQTGTVGWESLMEGKPCITFGLPWYSGCTSCFNVKNTHDVKKALALIPAQTKDIVEKNILKFIHYYQGIFFIGSLSDRTNVAYNTVRYELLIKEHSQKITNLFIRQKIYNTMQIVPQSLTY